MFWDDLVQRLVQFIIKYPDAIAGYGVAIGTLLLVWLTVYLFVKRPLLSRNRKLTEENRQLIDEKNQFEVRFERTRMENEGLRSEREALSAQLDECRQAKVRLEVTLERVEHDSGGLRTLHEMSSEENLQLREARARLETRLEATAAENESLRQAQQTLAAQGNELCESTGRLRTVLDKALAEAESAHDRSAALTEELKTSKESEARLGNQVSELADQVQRLAEFDGKVWEKTPTADVPEFWPLDQRKVPVIALANLKGGVGKTTLTANLGAILATQNLRVLLIDLDYQGSLTSLCLPPAEIRDVRRRELFVDRLFDLDPVGPRGIGPCSCRLAQLPAARLLAADEPLADTENRMMAQWLLNPNVHDVRYALRSSLHSEAVRAEYDFVLIDCPPRLTTACINAYCAADFLLIPVLLDRTSAEAVPRQLRSIRKLRRDVCPDLAVLGLVANRTFPRQSLIGRESEVWESLPASCGDSLGEPVHRFTTVVRQHAAFASAANANEFAALHRDVRPMFLDLAQEVRARIASHEREGSPTVPAEPPATA
ncbi:MAG: ParA family protein [Planctomycetota bacterium]